MLKGKANLGDIFQEKKNLSYEVGYNILESNFQLKITNLSSGFWRTKIPKQNLTEVLLSWNFDTLTNGNVIPLTVLLVRCLGTERPIISAPTRSVLPMYSGREAKNNFEGRGVGGGLWGPGEGWGGKTAHTKATDLIDIQVSRSQRQPRPDATSRKQMTVLTAEGTFSQGKNRSLINLHV